MLNQLRKGWAMQALFVVEEVEEGRMTKKEFKEVYGHSVRDAELALEALVDHLIRVVTKK